MAPPDDELERERDATCCFNAVLAVIALSAGSLLLIFAIKLNLSTKWNDGLFYIAGSLYAFSLYCFANIIFRLIFIKPWCCKNYKLRVDESGNEEIEMKSANSSSGSSENGRSENDETFRRHHAGSKLSGITSQSWMLGKKDLPPVLKSISSSDSPDDSHQVDSSSIFTSEVTLPNSTGYRSPNYENREFSNSSLRKSFQMRVMESDYANLHSLFGFKSIIRPKPIKADSSRPNYICREALSSNKVENKTQFHQIVPYVKNLGCKALTSSDVSHRNSPPIVSACFKRPVISLSNYKASLKELSSYPTDTSSTTHKASPSSMHSSSLPSIYGASSTSSHEASSPFMRGASSPSMHRACSSSMHGTILSDTRQGAMSSATSSIASTTHIASSSAICNDHVSVKHGKNTKSKKCMPKVLNLHPTSSSTKYQLRPCAPFTMKPFTTHEKNTTEFHEENIKSMKPKQKEVLNSPPTAFATHTVSPSTILEKNRYALHGTDIKSKIIKPKAVFRHLDLNNILQDEESNCSVISTQKDFSGQIQREVIPVHNSITHSEFRPLHGADPRRAPIIYQ